jgi:hypothetical protein
MNTQKQNCLTLGSLLFLLPHFIYATEGHVELFSQRTARTNMVALDSNTSSQNWGNHSHSLSTGEHFSSRDSKGHYNLGGGASLNLGFFKVGGGGGGYETTHTFEKNGNGFRREENSRTSGHTGRTTKRGGEYEYAVDEGGRMEAKVSGIGDLERLVRIGKEAPGLIMPPDARAAAHLALTHK